MTLREDSDESVRIIAEFFKNSGLGLAMIDRQLRYRIVNPYLAVSNGGSIESHIGSTWNILLGKWAFASALSSSD